MSEINARIAVCSTDRAFGEIHHEHWSKSAEQSRQGKSLWSKTWIDVQYMFC